MAKIIVVDDEPDLRFLMRRLLEKAGHEVDEAANGRAALDAIRHAPPDIVITDLGMPVMDGRRLIQELRDDNDTAQIPVVQWADEPDREIEADDVVLKRYLGEGVLDVVSRVLERRSN